jgi:hypothetical protein
MHLDRTVPANALHARCSAQFHYCLTVRYAEGITGTWKLTYIVSSYHDMHRLQARKQAS